jgi:oligosaccharide repeat unit polymerase
MAVAIIILLLTGLMLVFINRVEKSFLFPPFIFSGIWFLVLFVYVLVKIVDPQEMDNMRANTLLFLGFANISFTAGGLYLLLNYTRRPVITRFTPSKVPAILGDVIIVITLLTLVLLFFKAQSMASEIVAQNFFIALRHQLTNLRLDYGILGYFLVFGLFASLYRYLTFDRLSDLSFKERAKLIISFLISIGFLILSTGRTYFFFYFITLFIIIYFKGELKTRYMRIFFFLFLFLFILVGIVLSKGGSLTYTLSENISSSITHILAYLNGPLLAFDRFLNSDFSHTYGKNTFRFFFALLYKLNIIGQEPVDIVKEYVFVPYPTNVYTFFYTYVMDFGRIGTILLIFLFGMLNSWLFYKSKSSGNHVKLLAAFSYYPLLMVFFQDQYFSLLSFWIQLWFYSFIVLKISPMVVLRRRSDG